MAVKIRLARYGNKHRPFYRIVAADIQAPRDGRYIELLGTFDPLKDSDNVNLKKDRIDYWLSVGARPSETVANLLKKHSTD